MKVGDLVKCTMLADQNVGVVVEMNGRGGSTIRVHFLRPEEACGNPRWISVDYLETINEGR